MLNESEPAEEATPLLNRIFGGGARHRSQQLVRRRTSRRQEYDSVETGNANQSCSDGLRHVLEELERSDESNNRYILLGIFAVVNHVVGGIISMMFLEGWSFYDSAYYCIVTTTTVGYGDLSPTKSSSKLFTIYYVLVSIGIVSSYLAYFVGLLIDQQEELLLSRTVNPPTLEEIHNPTNTENPGEQIMAATEGINLSDYKSMAFSVAFLTAVLLTGFTIFRTLEGLSTLDALYATVISATTVGFGDLRPTHRSTKLCMTVWLIVSTIAVAKVVADFTDATVKAKQRGVTRRLLTAQMDRQSLQMLDHDRSGTVEWGEFLSAMLVSCGRIDEEELNTFRLRFNQLDKDCSGRIEINGEAEN